MSGIGGSYITNEDGEKVLQHRTADQRTAAEKAPAEKVSRKRGKKDGGRQAAAAKSEPKTEE